MASKAQLFDSGGVNSASPDLHFGEMHQILRSVFARLSRMHRDDGPGHAFPAMSNVQLIRLR
jgi:hypothetical protein